MLYNYLISSWQGKSSGYCRMPTSYQKQQCQWLVQDYQGRLLVAESAKSSRLNVKIKLRSRVFSCY